MKPSIHVAVSFSVGVALWFFTKSVYAALLCFLSGIFVDFDHIVEFIIHFGRKDFNFRKIYQVCEEMLFDRLYLIFHSAEIAILFWAAALYTKNIYLLSIAVGYSSHLLLDFIGNPIHAFSYFIIRRFIRGFETDRLMKKNLSRPKKRI